MKKSGVKALEALAISLCLFGCGGGSSNNSQPQEQQNEIVNPPTASPKIEDISCSVTYPLAISNIYQASNQLALPSLFDTDKTNIESWQTPTLNSIVIVELAAPSLIKEMVVTWENLDVSHLLNVSASKDKDNWQLIVNQEQSGKNTLIPDLIDLTELSASTALYLQIEFNGDDLSQPSKINEIEIFGCAEDVEHNVELIDWYLSVPTDEDNNGKSDSIKEDNLAAGYFDARFFGLSEDGGIRFSTSVSGYKTSTNTEYVRSELREMLRRGNTSYSTQGVNNNNWVFSSAPQIDKNNAGGINGQLHAELSVNQVTKTGEDYQIGRVIIGQIHANDDEPVRLYYRKLPNNINGSLYFAHEILGGDDIYFELIGSRSNSASNPLNGIPLNEKFRYSIEVEANELTVTIYKADGSEFSQSIDMSASGYDQGGQYMYFKAGVYNQNNSGDAHDYVQATFYEIKNSHEGYDESNN
ncbi:polysaccharide lyase family 7 protein [Thalassotalea sp. M1531]|uniref:Polysaccharide lyase family 7 protein n=1 Tax=Thalassotalea algicola TaxID=2716224 RepID=A0A7Y0Q729_9GAMM|nr:polysaccharide lyase family 7 protein [Thalassotalea algicola]NMP32599.1 polysaccharide lyase family 7 protein [Thalassotalea algicola]